MIIINTDQDKKAEESFFRRSDKSANTSARIIFQWLEGYSNGWTTPPADERSSADGQPSQKAISSG